MVAYERVGVSSTQRATTSQVDFELGNKQPSWLHLPTEKGHNNSSKYLEDPSSGHVSNDHTKRQVEKKNLINILPKATNKPFRVLQTRQLWPYDTPLRYDAVRQGVFVHFT